MKRRLIALLLTLALLVTALPLSAAAKTTDTGAKLIAFTFDDGPSRYTAQLLDGLKSRGVVATFFMTGVNGSSGITNYTSLLTRMRDEGHQLANHTYSHITPFNQQSASTVSSEVSKVESLLFQAMGGSYIDMVRTPGGAMGDTIRNTVPAPIILWSVDTLDWKYRNADTVYNNIISEAKDGAIVLLHDLYQTSVQGALRAIDTLKAQGYEFVTVAELMRRRGVSLSNGTSYSSAPNKGTNLPGYTAPTITSQAGAKGVQVTFSTSETGVTLYYTTDGTLPNLGSTKYTGPITITRDTTFTVAGIDKYGTRTPSTTKTVSGMVPAAAPTIHYEDGILTLSSATEGAAIYYTTDGSNPTTSSTLYTGGFTPGTTTKCVAVKSGYLNSAVVTCTLTKYGRMFTDVGVNQWYYDYVGEIVEQGRMVGTGDYTFSPNLTMTRAMMATVLYSMAGYPETTGTMPFTDVAEGAWYYDAVLWASANGIVAGVGDNRFNPGGTLTREQMALMFYRYGEYLGLDTSAQADLSGYKDAGKISGYAQTALSWCVAVGLISGMSTDTLEPRGSATRAQCAVVLLKFESVQEELTPPEEPEPAPEPEPTPEPEEPEQPEIPQETPIQGEPESQLKYE